MRLFPKQCRASGGPLTYPLARIQAARGPLQDIRRWLERPTHGIAATPSGVQQAWAAVQRRLDKVRVLGPEYAGLKPGGRHDQLAPLESLRRLRTTPVRKVRATPGWRRPGPPTRAECTEG